jgi:hypothetical protein
MTDGGCVACHAQPLTGLASEYATRRGWRVEPATADISQVVSSLVAGGRGMLQGRESGGLPDTQEYNAFMAAALNIPPSVSTETVVYYLVAKQRQAGNWHGIGTRAPIQDGDISRTAMAIRILSVYGAPARKADISGSHSPGRHVARRANTAEHRGARHATARSVLGRRGPPLRDKRLRELSDLQRRDGGWAQTPNLGSDAYATGQALFTLRELGLPGGEQHHSSRSGVPSSDAGQGRELVRQEPGDEDPALLRQRLSVRT